MNNLLNLKFNSIIELLDKFPDNDACEKYLEALIWDGVPVSPFDKTSKVYRCNNGRYRCKNTGKYFNIKTGTIFENTKIPLRYWFAAIYYVTSNTNGVSSTQLAKHLNVTQCTAWKMIQKINVCLGVENNNKLSNEVELDETYVGGKNKNRHKDKKST